jgi:hypothetical protein
MSLKPEQINFISYIDQKVKDILSSGGNEISIMISLLDEISQMKTLINSANQKELQNYCNSHDGFDRYMKRLENTANVLAGGV